MPDYSNGTKYGFAKGYGTGDVGIRVILGFFGITYGESGNLDHGNAHLQLDLDGLTERWRVIHATSDCSSVERYGGDA